MRATQQDAVSETGNRPTPVLAFAVLGCSLLTAADPAAADDGLETVTASAYELEEIIVTASRHEENAFSVPYSVSVQTMTDLQENRQVRTIPDAMREMAGVMVQKTGHGQGSPYIRGFTGLRTLFLIDGIRLNNSTFREGPNQYWNTVDPLSIYRLELVKGPSSVMYGSDAIGGTVNAITRSYSDLSQQSGTQGRLVVRGATAEQSLVTRPEFGYSNGSIEMFGGLSYKDFGTLHAGGDTGDQPMTGYTEQGGDIKISFDLGGNRRLVTAIQHVDQDDAWRTHKTVFGKSWRGTTTGSELQRSLDQRRTLAYVQYHASQPGSTDGNLTLSASWHDQGEQRLRIRSDGRIDRQGTDVGTLGLWGQYDVNTRTGRWTGGAEFYRDDVDSFRDDFNPDGSFRQSAIQGPVSDDANYTTAAVFLQNQYSFGETSILTSGVRYTWSEADARGVQDPLSGARVAVRDDWSDMTASIRFSRQLRGLDKARWFAGVSQGFRAPNLSDLTRYDTARSNEIETPVAGLDAEEFVTYEIGLKYAGERWNNQVSFFYTDIDDMIIRTPTGRVIDGDNEITKRNSGNGYVNGLELQGRYHFNESWSAFGNLTWVDGEVDTFPFSTPELVREPLDRLMPATLYLGGRWQPPQSRFWLEGLVTAVDNQDELSTRDLADTDRIPVGGTPSYTTLTIRGGWQVAERMRLSLSLENLTDEDYRVHGSGVNEPGRNAVLSLFWNN